MACLCRREGFGIHFKFMSKLFTFYKDQPVGYGWGQLVLMN